MECMPVTTADDFIEQQLDIRLCEIEAEFDADGLVFSGPLTYTVDDEVRDIVEHLVKRDDHRDRLLVLLTTFGGYIEVVQRIVETLRHHYGHVAFVIPNYAFSAGTILAMSGDEIHMDYYSRLGPIDPQVQKSDGTQVPALGYLAQWERLIEKARTGDLTMAEAQLMVDGFDQAELYKYEQARELSVALLTDWLVRYKFADWRETESKGTPVTNEMRQQRAEEIARILNESERWHSHGHGIAMTVLHKDVGLRIDDLDQQPERCAKIRQYNSLLQDFMHKTRKEGTLHVRGTLRQFA